MGGIVTPGEIAGRQLEVHQGILSLNDQIATARVFNTTQLSAWRRFRDSWAVWYRDNSSWLARSWGSTLDTTDQYARLLAGWRTAYEQAYSVAHPGEAPPPGGPPVPGPTTPPGGGSEGPSLFSMTDAVKALGIGALVIGGIVLANKMQD